MKLLVIILFLAVPLVLIIGNLVRKLLGHSGNPRQNGILMTIGSLLVLASAIFEEKIFNWLFTQFGGRMLLYLTIWMGYVAALALVHEILSIVLLQKKMKITPFLFLVPLVALGVYCIINAPFLAEVLDIWVSEGMV